MRQMPVASLSLLIIWEICDPKLLINRHPEKSSKSLSNQTLLPPRRCTPQNCVNSNQSSDSQGVCRPPVNRAKRWPKVAKWQSIVVHLNLIEKCGRSRESFQRVSLFFLRSIANRLTWMMNWGFKACKCKFDKSKHLLNHRRLTLFLPLSFALFEGINVSLLVCWPEGGLF